MSLIRTTARTLLLVPSIVALSGVLSALPAASQVASCPWSDDPVPEDTLHPALYYPLEVGNRWEYTWRQPLSAWPDSIVEYEVREIVSDTVIAGQDYVVQETRLHYAQLSWGNPLRYSEEDSTFFQHIQNPAPGQPHEIHWPGVPCHLRDHLSENECGQTFLAEFCYSDVIVLGGDEVPIRSIRRYGFVGFYADILYAHGLGPFYFAGDGGPVAELIHARVGGQEFGQSAVSKDEEPLFSEKQTLDIVGIFPNPFTNIVSIRSSGGTHQSLRLDVFDLLGRLIWGQTIVASPSAETETKIDACGWPSGMYIFRITGSSGSRSDLAIRSH